MLKKVISVVLIILAAGAWLYLDHLNKQEQILAEQTRQNHDPGTRKKRLHALRPAPSSKLRLWTP